MTGVAGYRDVVAHRTTRRLLGASVVSSLGDFVGAGALLVLAYERAGGAAVGPAAFLAATGAGALVVAFGVSGHLDRVSRRGGLVLSELVGALALLLPVFVPTLSWPRPCWRACATTGPDEALPRRRCWACARSSHTRSCGC